MGDGTEVAGADAWGLARDSGSAAVGGLARGATRFALIWKGYCSCWVHSRPEGSQGGSRERS